MTVKSPSFPFLSLLDQLKGIALEGLAYAPTPYDKARYSKLLKLYAMNLGKVLEVSDKTLLRKFRKEIEITTPKFGANAAILNTKGELLILKRSDDARWCLPCGWADIQESAAEASAREAFEETGLKVKPLGYIAVSTKGPQTGDHIYHQINIVTLMKTVPTKAKVKLSHEHTDFMWIKKMPPRLNWHAGQKEEVLRIFAFLASNQKKILKPI